MTPSVAFQPAPGTDCQLDWRASFLARLADLREAAIEDDLTFAETSLDHAEAFLATLSKAVRPGVFLLDNGHVRLLWRNAEGEQVGLEFRPDGDVRFVLFALEDGRLYPSSGIAPMKRMLEQIETRGLGRLMRR